MESEKYDWTLTSEPIYEDEEEGPYQQYVSLGDAELARKRKELESIEKQIARKKASIALKRNELQRPPLKYQCNDDKDGAEDDKEDSNPGPASFMKNAVEKRNAKISQGDFVQFDIKESTTTSCHHQSEHALPSSDCKSPDKQLDFFSVYRSKGARRRNSPGKGFDRFLSILNKGVDEEKLSEIARETKAGDVKGKPAAPIQIEKCNIEDLEDEDEEDSREKHRDPRGSERSFKSSRSSSKHESSHSRDKDKRLRGNGRYSEERERSERGERSDSRHRHHGSDGWKSRRDSRERVRRLDSRRREVWDSRETSRARHSREREWSWDSRDTDRGWDSREGKRNLDLRERHRDSRHRRLKSKESDRYSDDRCSRSKTGDWEQDKTSGDRNQRQEDLSPGRRHSRDRRNRRSRSRSSSLSAEDMRRKMEKEEQFSRIQSLLQTVGLELGVEEVDRLNSRTQERLYGVKPQTGERERKHQRQERDSSWSASSDDYSPDYKTKTRDSQEHSTTRYHDAERSWRDSKGHLTESPSQLPQTDYASYQNWYNSLYHNNHVQNWAAVGWSGAPTPGPVAAYGPYDNSLLGSPPSTASPLLSTGSYNAPYQFPPHQYAPYVELPLQFPSPQQEPSLPPLPEQTSFLKPLQEVSLPPTKKERQLIGIFCSRRFPRKITRKNQIKKRLARLHAAARAATAFNTIKKGPPAVTKPMSLGQRLRARARAKARARIAAAAAESAAASTSTAAKAAAAAAAAAATTATPAEAGETDAAASDATVGKPVIVLRLKSGKVTKAKKDTPNTGTQEMDTFELTQ